jgi:hypothetical protein
LKPFGAAAPVAARTAPALPAKQGARPGMTLKAFIDILFAAHRLG